MSDLFPQDALYGLVGIHSLLEGKREWVQSDCVRTNCRQVVGFLRYSAAEQAIHDFEFDRSVWVIRAFMPGEYQRLNDELRREAEMIGDNRAQFDPTPRLGWLLCIIPWIAAGLWCAFIDRVSVIAAFCVVAAGYCWFRAWRKAP